MKVFKFGGASVKDAEGVKNVLNVLEKTGNSDRLIVISAMGKTTNALELVVKDYLEIGGIPQSLQKIREFHMEILQQLFPQDSAAVYNKIEETFSGWKISLTITALPATILSTIKL